MLGGQFGLVSNSIHYTSIVKEEYYNVLISSMSVGNHSVDINCKEASIKKMTFFPVISM